MEIAAAAGIFAAFGADGLRGPEAWVTFLTGSLVTAAVVAAAPVPAAVAASVRH